MLIYGKKGLCKFVSLTHQERAKRLLYTSAKIHLTRRLLATAVHHEIDAGIKAENQSQA